MGAQIARSPVTGTRTAGAGIAGTRTAGARIAGTRTAGTRTEHPPVVGGALRGSKAREAAR